MSTRFNRNDVNVPDDRLFADDFIADQNGQDADLLQLATDFGCLPCIGSGLEITSQSEVEHKVAASAGWAYDTDGRRITVGSSQDVVLTDTSGGNNYLVISWLAVTDTPRNAHRTGTSYQTRKHDSFQINVQASAPAAGQICLANCKQTGTGTISIELAERISRSCKLVSQDKVPGVEQEGETESGGPADPPPSGQQKELPDLPRGRTVPMPIILSGTRNGESRGGIETILPEDLGRTTDAVANVTLGRFNVKAGTPLADVKIWIGDWGSGQRDGSEPRKCNFTMPTRSGVTAWDDDLWITDDPGPGYYYLVKHDETWYAKIVDSGSDWVLVEDGKEVPSGASAEYYICPYAPKYRSQAIPYKTDLVIHPDHFFPVPIHDGSFGSPVAPMVLVKDLNLGGKYKFQVASMVSSDRYTKWAEQDFIVGSDLVVCWQPTTEYLNATPVDGGVLITIPAIGVDSVLPHGYELCYVYGDDYSSLVDPSFDNEEHHTLYTSERVIELKVPPGKVVKVIARAINHRMVMKCASVAKILTPDYDTTGHIIAGGITLRRNRKMFTGTINESGVAASTAELADQVPLANPIWPEKIQLFNPQSTLENPQTDFEVYVHGSNQPYTDGRKILIASGGDQESISPKGSAELTISDYRITDSAMKISIKNLDTSAQDFELRYGIQYREDSETEG